MCPPALMLIALWKTSLCSHVEGQPFLSGFVGLCLFFSCASPFTKIIIINNNNQLLLSLRCTVRFFSPGQTEHLAFFCESPPKVGLWASIGPGKHGGRRQGRGKAVLSRCPTPSLCLANLNSVRLITYLSNLLAFASLSLPQNGTGLKENQ